MCLPVRTTPGISASWQGQEDGMVLSKASEVCALAKQSDLLLSNYRSCARRNKEMHAVKHSGESRNGYISVRTGLDQADYVKRTGVNTRPFHTLRHHKGARRRPLPNSQKDTHMDAEANKDRMDGLVGEGR